MADWNYYTQYPNQRNQNWTPNYFGAQNQLAFYNNPMQNFYGYTPITYADSTTFTGNTAQSTTQSTTQSAVEPKITSAADYEKILVEEYKILKKQRNDLEFSLNNVEKQKNALTETSNIINNATETEEAVVVKSTMADYKKLPWWKKATRALSNMGQGVINLATKFVGIEDGKWNWKKCLKNVAISAAAIGLCSIPYVGPVITTGLIASGVISGGIAVGKGIHKASKAKTLEEVDGAYQEIGAGAFIGITSALGLKGLGKGFRVGNPTQASTAVSRTSTAGKAWQATSQAARDICVNSVKATKVSMNQQAAMFNTIKAESGTLSAFGKVYKQNLGNVLPKLGKKKFDEAKQNVVNKLEQRIQEIGKPSDKALMAEKESLIQQLKQLERIKTREQWLNFEKDSNIAKTLDKLQKAATELQAKGKVTVKGRKLSSANEADIKLLNDMIARLQASAKEVNSLVKLKMDAMNWMAMRPTKNKSDLVAFTGQESSTRLGYLYDIHKGNISWWKLPFKALWELMALPFQPWEYMKNTPAGSLYKIEAALLPVYEKNFFLDMFSLCGLDLASDKTISKEEYAALVEQYNSTKETLDSTEATLRAELDKLG